MGKELARIGAEEIRRKEAIFAGVRTGLLATRGIVGLHDDAHAIMVPTLERFAERLDRPRTDNAQRLVHAWTEHQVLQLFGHVGSHLDTAASAIIGIAGETYDLEEDTRPRLVRWIEGDRR